MDDLLKMLSNRQDEIGSFITTTNAEREQLMARLSDLDQGLNIAERDMTRIRRAIKALDGAHESDAMGGAVLMADELVPAPRNAPSSLGYQPRP